MMPAGQREPWSRPKMIDEIANPIHEAFSNDVFWKSPWLKRRRRKARNASSSAIGTTAIAPIARNAIHMSRVLSVVPVSAAGIGAAGICWRLSTAIHITKTPRPAAIDGQPARQFIVAYDFR